MMDGIESASSLRAPSRFCGGSFRAKCQSRRAGGMSSQEAPRWSRSICSPPASLERTTEKGLSRIVSLLIENGVIAVKAQLSLRPAIDFSRASKCRFSSHFCM
eukprot:scaffold213_cov245-Pinguiococcus_pyrenoidosus.AAC.14